LGFGSLKEKERVKGAYNHASATKSFKTCPDNGCNFSEGAGAAKGIPENQTVVALSSLERYFKLFTIPCWAGFSSRVAWGRKLQELHGACSLSSS